MLIAAGRKNDLHGNKIQTVLRLLLTGILVVFVSSSVFSASLAKPDASTNVLNLSLAEAIKLAQSHNPLPLESQARVMGAEARLRSAHALPNPTVTLVAPFGSGTGGLDEDITIAQPIELNGKRKPRIRAARAERDAAISESSATVVDLTQTVEYAYYNALLADENYGVVQEALTIAKQFADAAQIQYQAGDVAQSNVLRSATEVARAQQDLTVADTDRSNRYASLRSLIGVSENTTLNLTNKLSFTPVDYSLTHLQEQAMCSRPDIKAAKFTAESLAATVRATKAQLLPDLFVEGRRASFDPSTPGESIRIGVAFPLVDLGRNRADVEAAQATLTEQDAKLAETIRVAKLEVETSFNDLMQARKTVESFQSGRIERAKEIQDMAQTGYEKGANSYLEVLDAQRTYRSELADYARAMASYNIALATLNRAVGGCLK